MPLDRHPDQIDLMDLIAEDAARNRKRPRRLRAARPTADLITPREIIAALGPFDLDPCAATRQPWPCASSSISLPANGLEPVWKGRVWLSPPHGIDTSAWVRKLADHGHGTALLLARTDADWFQAHVWKRARGVLFMTGRMRYVRPNGIPLRPAGLPTLLVAYGSYDAERLRDCGLDGSYISLSHSSGGRS